LSFNSGSNFARNGFINYTVGLSQQDNAVRSGKIDIPTEVATFGGDPTTDANIAAFLKVNPTGGNINGTASTSAEKFSVNLGIPISENGQFYSNAAFVSKKVLSNANYRQPYWKKDYGLLHITDPNGVNYTGDNTLNAVALNSTRGMSGICPPLKVISKIIMLPWA